MDQQTDFNADGLSASPSILILAFEIPRDCKQNDSIVYTNTNPSILFSTLGISSDEALYAAVAPHKNHYVPYRRCLVIAATSRTTAHR